MEKDNIFYYSPKTLNIFCDASIKKMPDGETISCPGAIAVVTGENGFQDIIEDKFDCLRFSTNNRGELTAILLALQLANKYKDNFYTINIFSDSKISVCGLRDWIFGWVKKVDKEGYMISSSGERVMNQDIIIHIISYVVNNNIKFNLYHCKGHVNESGGPTNAVKVFNTSNRVNVWNMNMVKLMAQFNDKIDVLTGKVLDTYVPEPVGEVVRPIKCVLAENTMKNYKRLLVNSN